MRCHEARQYLACYLDSELDVDATLKVEQHLEWCPDCARVFEAEARVENRLASVLKNQPGTPALWKDIERQLRGERHGSRELPARFLAWKKTAWAFAAAAFGLLLVFAVWTTGKPLDLAEISAIHHQEFLDHKITAEFRSDPPPSLLRKIEDRPGREAFSYAPSRTAYKNSGARLCFLKDVPSAMRFGEWKNTPVSLLVFKREDLARFPSAQRRLEGGTPIVCSRVGRYQFAVRLIGRHAVCVIGELPKSTVEDLLRSVASL